MILKISHFFIILKCVYKGVQYAKLTATCSSSVNQINKYCNDAIAYI